MVKKRQEIGRGLRLAVDADGNRIADESVNKLYIMASESYEEFARSLQTEYEVDCGVTFGKVPLRAIASLAREVEGLEEPIGDAAAQLVLSALVSQEMLHVDGRIGSAFDPARLDFKLILPAGFEGLEPAVVDLLSSYRLERHVRRERSEGRNSLKKEVLLSPEFIALWDRIKPKTTFRVEFETSSLIKSVANKVRYMEPITSPTVRVVAGALVPKRAGVDYSAVSSAEEAVSFSARGLPDILAYLQEQTQLTRSSIYQMLRDSGRLAEFFTHPQRFMDTV